MTALAEAPPAAAQVDRRRALGDVVAAAALGWALWTLARTDGGVDLIIHSRAAWPLLAAAPVAALELRRASRWAPWLLAWYGSAALAAVVFGGTRAGFVQPAIVYGMLPVAALLTMRLWRRRHGPALVGGLLAMVFVVTWWEGLLAWAGGLFDPDAFETWRSLSWHNQSAILTGSLGLVGTGVALAARRRAGLAAAVGVAGSAFAATWLTGSRGGLAAVLLGALAVAVGTGFGGGRRWVAVAAASVAAVVLLTSFAAGEPVSQAIGNKGLAAGDSVSARFDHMAAAVAMLTERPLLGHGLGSYGRAAAAFAPGDSIPSYHAHNELLEPFAEGGIFFGAAMLALAAGVGLAALRVLRRGVDPGDASRGGVLAGSVGALAALASHALVDFDWVFPLLALLAGVVAGVVLAAEPAAPARRLVWLGLAPVAALLAVGLGGTLTLSESPPWSAQVAAGDVQDLLAGHDARGALARAREARRWNPGDRMLRTLEAAAAHEAGLASAAELMATLDAAAPSLAAYNVAAASLVRTGAVDEAGEVLATVTELYRERPAWPLDGSIDETWRLRVVVAGRRGGCPDAQAAAAALAVDPLTQRIAVPEYEQATTAFCH